ncbi:MAG: peptidase T [Spirochaetaceae bacterium]|jgi:tripeptide aminopeptidase|nr:peptidase T [Spirochaetaceae bacterium]
MKDPAVIDAAALENMIVPRFLAYVRVCTTSDSRSETTPTSEGQWDLARMLEEELKRLGAAEVTLTGACYVIARIPASVGKEGAPVIGFMAHLDTSPDAPGADVQPVLVRNYDGRRIALDAGIALDPALDADLAAQTGRDIIHTSGATLLGADDKAGIAEIMGAVEFLLLHPEISHGPLEIIFTPDEETGKGLPQFPVSRLRAETCYTLDGGPEGELEIECFNAYGVDVHFQGKVIHPGTARGIMLNAALMSSVYAAMLPRSESPEATDGYYGYYCLTRIQGNHEEALAEFILRDFSRDGIDRRLAAMDAFARAVEAQFPGGTVTVTAKPQYFNMREKIETRPAALEKLKTAAERVGINFLLKPIRGGTDGSRLTELGIPTPNIFTGGRNFHSRSEWISVPEMTAACRLIIELAREWAG